LVKAEGAGTDGQALLSDAGRVRPQTMVDAFFNDSYRFLPEPLGRVLREAKGVLARTGNPQLADFNRRQGILCGASADAEDSRAHFCCTMPES
jgi:hypothetical protein